MSDGVGVDVGTATLVSAKIGANGIIVFNKQLDCFFTLEKSDEVIYLLDNLKVPYIEKKNKISVVGEVSRKFANMFKTETRRPLQTGCLNKKDIDSFGILQVMISSLVDKPKKAGEILKYSVTSSPLEKAMDFEYHKSQIENIFRSLGYVPSPVQEARCLALAELGKEQFSGLAISCGAGSTTVWMGQYGLDNPNLQFSIGIGGDWIDSNAADMFEGLTKTKVQMVKEKGMSINDPLKGINVDELEGNALLEARAREAISAYYKAYIKNVFKAIKQKFEKEQLPEFDGPIKCVIAGGTSMPKDFIQLAKAALKDYSFGVEIDEVIFPKDPLLSVAKGALIAAQLETRKGEKNDKS